MNLKVRPSEAVEFLGRLSKALNKNYRYNASIILHPPQHDSVPAHELAQHLVAVRSYFSNVPGTMEDSAFELQLNVGVDHKGTLELSKAITGIITEMRDEETKKKATKANQAKKP